MPERPMARSFASDKLSRGVGPEIWNFLSDDQFRRRASILGKFFLQKDHPNERDHLLGWVGGRRYGGTGLFWAEVIRAPWRIHDGP